MRFNFPRTRFADENGIIGQLLKIQEELDEALSAAMTPDLDHTFIEIMDIGQAWETLVHICKEQHGMIPGKARSETEVKNHIRGYYNSGGEVC
jgi:hypothetical protein